MKHKEAIRYFPMGDFCILLTWPETVNEDLLAHLLTVKKSVYQQKGDELIEIINTYNALLIKYRHRIKDYNQEIGHLKEIIKTIETVDIVESHLYYLPVCYETEWGWDLATMAKEKKRTVDEIIALHTLPVYTVYFIGFLPGFPYLGGLKKDLFMARKAHPRRRIPMGAVGIGGQQTGIYPQASPGGWQLIGNCPIPLFNPKETPPATLSAADKIKFYSVSINEYKTIQEDMRHHRFELKKEIWPLK